MSCRCETGYRRRGRRNRVTGAVAEDRCVSFGHWRVQIPAIFTTANSGQPTADGYQTIANQGKYTRIESYIREMMGGLDMPQQLLQQVHDLKVPLDRDVFLRNLIRALAGTLEEVVGLSEASGFISVVGQTIGDEINRDYRLALGTSSLTRPQVAKVLIDLKRRINGDFYIIEEDDRKIVLGNRRCPFEEKVLGQRST